MQLTSHEYVICQENKWSPLILSEFTGSYSKAGFVSLSVNTLVSLDFGCLTFFEL